MTKGQIYGYQQILDASLALYKYLKPSFGIDFLLPGCLQYCKYLPLC